MSGLRDDQWDKIKGHFMKKLAFIALFALSACASGPCRHSHSVVEKGNDQVQYAQRYINFLIQFGSAGSVNQTEKISHPFHDNCKKTMNHEVVANSADEFINQLSEAKKVAPIWKISNVHIYPHLKENSATISYNISASGLGDFTVIKLINFCENGDVLNVSEVCVASSQKNNVRYFYL